MASTEIETLWQSAFGDLQRPQIYASAETDEDNFRPLNDPQNFITDISDYSNEQLYALSSNSQLAMKLAQQEYLELERRIATIKGKPKESVKDPQTPQESESFEDRKESGLYGYKYEPHKPALLHAGLPGLKSADELSEREKHDVRLFQEPFQQGGFVPTQREYKTMLANAKNPSNVDGWKPVTKRGKKLIPRQQIHHDEYTIRYTKKSVEHHNDHDRVVSPASEASLDASNKLVNKRLTRTRFDGRKHPPTREVSEAPSGVSTPARKRISSPLLDFREGTPTKRRKVRGQDMQRTDSNAGSEISVVPVASRRNNISATSGPSWNLLSPNSLRRRKWTDEELVEAVKHNHLWLHDDPAKAEDWKHKIIHGTNPVRSFSMFKKWAYWKDENKDKRPRGKKDGLGKHVQGNTSVPNHVGRRRAVNGLKNSSSASPYPQSPLEVATVDSEDSTKLVPALIKLGVHIKHDTDNDETEDDMRPGIETRGNYRFTDRGSQFLHHNKDRSPYGSERTWKKEDTGDEIVVNLEDLECDLSSGKRGITVTPVLDGPMTTTNSPVPTPTRRSARNSRRGSA